MTPQPALQGDTSVVILAADERVATHRRIYWEELAAKLGEEVFSYVCELFNDQDALLPLRKVQAIVTFLQDYPPERREAACRRARFLGVTRVRGFKDILRKGLDAELLPDALVQVCGDLDVPRFARTAAAFITTTPEA